MADATLLQKLDSAHYLHPFTNFKKLAGAGSRIIVRAEGVYLWDSDGNQILDGMSGLWCVNIGYGRSELSNVAKQQMQELPYYNSFFQCAHPPVVTLAQRLAKLVDGYGSIFFTSSGSESNDTVLRLVWRYWQLQGQPKRRVVISRKNAYHGSTIAGASLGGMSAMHNQIGTLLSDIVHIRQPHHFQEGEGMSPEEFGLEAARDLEVKIEELGAEKVAAFIAEPVQGAGGVIVPPDTYWPEIQRICDKHGILFVSDEVICGFGRLGHWFGFEHYGVHPHIFSFAKGLTSGYLPMGGVMLRDDVKAVLYEDGDEFTHGYTYSGHPVCAAVAMENIRILEEENIVFNASSKTGSYFRDSISSLADHPLVLQTRSAGMMAAIEVGLDHQVQEKRTELAIHCRDISVEQGLVMRTVGSALLLAPPLTISNSEIDELAEKARKTFDLTLEIAQNL